MGALFAALPLCAAASTGLSSSQTYELRRYSFAAVLHSLPPGFYVQKVSAGSNSYTVYYYRSGGATIQFSATSASTHAAHHGNPSGFMHGVSSFFSGLHHHLTSTANPQTANEEEQEMSGITADSQAIGPIHFVNQGGCLIGKADRTKAEPRYRNATFTVRACGFRNPDPLIRAYRSVAAP